jgi:uncharacterized protein
MAEQVTQRRVRESRQRKRKVARLWRYLVLRLTRLRASPHEVALGFAAGAAVSVTPLIGLHLVLAVVIAFITRASLIAAALGTILGNPLTLPFFFAASYWIGDRISGLFAAPGVDALLEGLEEAEEEEAEIAADLIISASDDVFREGWIWTNLEGFWPVFSTMLLGSLPLAALTYSLCYLVIGAAIRAVARSREG